jgi:PTH1 family peptidyl-tRNA hydrolase
MMEGGGSGGHNGLKSITGLIGGDYARLRVGVDRPPSTDPDVVAEFVLSPFRESRAEVDALTADAADAVELWLDAGPEAAANAVNRLGG